MAMTFGIALIRLQEGCVATLPTKTNLLQKKESKICNTAFPYMVHSNGSGYSNYTTLSTHCFVPTFGSSHNQPWVECVSQTFLPLARPVHVCTPTQDLTLAMADGGVDSDCVVFNRLASSTLTLCFAAFCIPLNKKNDINVRFSHFIQPLFRD